LEMRLDKVIIEDFRFQISDCYFVSYDSLRSLKKQLCFDTLI